MVRLQGSTVAGWLHGAGLSMALIKLSSSGQKQPHLGLSTSAFACMKNGSQKDALGNTKDSLFRMNTEADLAKLKLQKLLQVRGSRVVPQLESFASSMDTNIFNNMTTH